MCLHCDFCHRRLGLQLTYILLCGFLAQGWTDDMTVPLGSEVPVLDEVGTPVMELFLQRDEQTGAIKQQVGPGGA